MRTVELARVAANAEKLRLQALAKRQAMRAVYGIVAGLFGLAVLIGLHLLGYQLLRFVLSPVISTLIVVVVDIVILVVCGIMAIKSVPGVVELEAVAIRQQALREMRTSLTLLSLVGPVSRLMGGRRSSGMALGAIAARLMARR